MRWREWHGQFWRAARQRWQGRCASKWKQGLLLDTGVFMSPWLIISVTYYSFMSVLCCKWTAYNPLFIDLIWLVINTYGVRIASSSWRWGRSASHPWASWKHPACLYFKIPSILICLYRGVGVDISVWNTAVCLLLERSSPAAVFCTPAVMV